MSTATLTRPAVGLMPPGHDPRPCVNKPPQWWDTGNEHNPRAVRYCRNVCPRLARCRAEITNDPNKPKGQIRAGRAYNEYGKEIGICPDCDNPRSRTGPNAPVVCGCTPPEVRDNLIAIGKAVQAKADQEKKTARRVAREVVLERYLPLRDAGLDMKEAAERLGINHNTLKAAVRRARRAGDDRVPYTRATNGSRKQQVAA